MRLIASAGVSRLRGKTEAIRLERPRLRNTALAPARSVSLSEPPFRQIEATVDERVAFAAGVAGENADLTIVHFADRAAPLPRHPDRVAAFLGKARAIYDVNTIFFTQRLVHQLPVFVQQLLIVPTALADKLRFLDLLRPGSLPSKVTL